MANKTTIHAEEGKQDLVISRDFDLPLELLFKAYADPEIIEQWMGTKVLKLESKNHGSFKFETSNPEGQVVFQAHGVIHEFITNRKITRTFEMENALFDVQLEFLEFERLSDDASRLNIHIVYRSVSLRDQMMKLPFAKSLNMAHNRLQEIAGQLI